MEIKELGIKNSKLAEKVMKILSSYDDKFEIARRMTNIALSSVHSNLNKLTIDLAIEYANTPNLKYTMRDWQKIYRWMQKFKTTAANLLKDDHKIVLLIDRLMEAIPKPISFQVYMRLAGARIQSSKRPFTPHRLRAELCAIKYLIEDLSDESAKNELMAIVSKMLDYRSRHKRR